MPMTILKKVGVGIVGPITEIANAIVEEAKWPEKWKHAEIKPIWKKKGDRGDPKFYRPIALLPAIARLIERVIAQQIKMHIKENNILPGYQHGFRAKHSPVSAVTQLISQIQGGKK